jgi:diaminopimelate decarboxylase
MKREKFCQSLYRVDDKDLCCEEISLNDIASKFSTPTYVYSYSQLIENCKRFIQAFSSSRTTICFAVKANGNLSILRTIFSQGLGADIVSEGELARSLKAGCSADKIVFSGVGKKRTEMEAALRLGPKMFNIESPFELEMLGAVAKEMGVQARISFRINPNIDAKTHSKISTGLYETKFGLPEEDIPELLNRIRREKNLDLVGMSCHIGSQITNLAPLRETARRMAHICTSISQLGWNLRYIDLGGGLGIPYQNEIVPSVEDYAQCLIVETQKLNLELIIEPGRSIVGDAGFLLSRVIGTKQNKSNCFVILDAAMNDLIRPALYDSYHPIIPVSSEKNLGNRKVCQFVGPICETGDILGTNRQVAVPKNDDLFVIGYAGAYGSAMSSQYNTRPRAAEVLINRDQAYVIRRREELEDLWALEEPIQSI